MSDLKLLEAANELVKSMDKTADDMLPKEITGIVKSHTKKATIASLLSGWIPGIGAIVALAIAAGFIWTMYGRINSKIGLPVRENIMKSVIAGVATNITSAVFGGIILSTIFSFLPGVGSLASIVIIGLTIYGLTLASGLMYLKILTKAGRRNNIHTHVVPTNSTAM